MNRLRLSTFLASVSVSALCFSTLTPAAASAIPAGAVTGENVGATTSKAPRSSNSHTRTLMVKFKNADNLRAASGALSTYRKTTGSALNNARVGPTGVVAIDLGSAQSLAAVQALADRYKANSAVEWAEPSIRRFVIPDVQVSASEIVAPLAAPASAPNDPYYAAGQWGLNGMYGVQAEAGWSVTRGSSDVVVAVLDTGFTNHPDLNNST
ncbi:MAG: hypothetical protein F2839_02875, partial [Actinobacteria bacterium]|nr:hypothetical protein [Actinomycetota bacterium]